jgi:hypothetical protein
MQMYEGQKLEQSKVTVVASFSSSGLEREHAFRWSLIGHHERLQRRNRIFPQGPLHAAHDSILKK